MSMRGILDDKDVGPHAAAVVGGRMAWVWKSLETLDFRRPRAV